MSSTSASIPPGRGVSSLIKKHTALARRAENIIWNAAGNYHFDPPYLAYYENGTPDPYFNLVIGLAHKWLDLDRIAAFLDQVAKGPKGDELTDLLWLGIENCVYEKELPQRPRLVDLRRRKAEAFFKNRQTLSRQQMMLQSVTVYTQQEARWSKVLGKAPRLSKREAELAEALAFPASLDTDGMLQKMQQILEERFHLRPGSSDTSLTPVTGLRRKIAAAVLRHEHQNTDTLLVRAGTGAGVTEGAAVFSHEGAGGGMGAGSPADAAYLAGTLGPLCLREKELASLEHDLCTGPHARCRLWVSKKGPAGETPQDLSAKDVTDLLRVQKDAKAQNAKNLAFWKENAIRTASGVRRLSARVDEILSGTERALPERARAGVLSPEIAYRLPVLHDPNVFLHTGEETQRSVSLDLLLDASASRLDCQEELSAQADVIAKSFERARVPVQVSCFRSLRGYTALQILKERGTRDTSGIAAYFAGGWNRDGLGLRLAGRFLPKEGDFVRRFLFVLTDASPNDSVKIPPEGGRGPAREYQGNAAVLDAKEAVAELREEGIAVGAIFLGPTLYLENLHTIYGKECVRIHRIDQLEEAVSTLLAQALEGVENVC